MTEGNLSSARTSPGNSLGWLQGTKEASGTVATALGEHGYDYEVGLYPMHVRHRSYGKEMRKGVPEHKAVVRLDTGQPIWVVGDRFKVVQHLEAFGALDTLVAEGQMQIEGVQSLRNGRRVMLVSSIPEPLIIAGEEFKRYQAWFNGHDGKTPLAMVSAPTRVFCTNVLPGLLSIAGKKAGSYKIKHTRRVYSRLADAQEEAFGARGGGVEDEPAEPGWVEEELKAMRSTLEVREENGLRYDATNAMEREARYVMELQKVGEDLAGRHMGTRGFDGFLKQLVPITPEMSTRATTLRDEKRADIRSIWLSSDDLGNIRDSAWGAFQSVIMWSDHFKNYKSIDSKVESIMKGSPDVAKALELLRN